MALDFRSDVHLEMDALMSTKAGLGIDGVFVDCPITGVAWRTAQQIAAGRRRSWTDQGALDKFRRQTDGLEPPLAVPPPQPVAAAITLAITAAVVLACFVWVWCRRRRDAHGSYKAMTPPRNSGDGAVACERQSEMSWSVNGARVSGEALGGDVESGCHAQSDGGGVMWSPGGQRVGNRSIAENRAVSANGMHGAR